MESLLISGISGERMKEWLISLLVWILLPAILLLIVVPFAFNVLTVILLLTWIGFGFMVLNPAPSSY